jgi:hypothetical protein
MGFGFFSAISALIHISTAGANKRQLSAGVAETQSQGINPEKLRSNAELTEYEVSAIAQLPVPTSHLSCKSRI